MKGMIKQTLTLCQAHPMKGWRHLIKTRRRVVSWNKQLPIANPDKGQFWMLLHTRGHGPWRQKLGRRGKAHLGPQVCQEKNLGRVQTHRKEASIFCNTTRCRYCPKLNKAGSIKSCKTGKSHQCMVNISCRSLNLIYCITCKVCDKQYVGQTSLRVRTGLFIIFWI